jgi:DNA-binding Lrp family transcriptional regulator
VALDPLDIRVLRELLSDGARQRLQTNPRRPYSEVAARVGVSEDTVRNRVKKLHGEGFLRAIPVGVNPRVFGFGTSFVFFEDASPNPAATAAAVGDGMGVLWMVQYVGPCLGILLAHRDIADRDEAVQRLRPLARPGSLVVVDHTFPDLPFELRPIDWRIVRVLTGDPRGGIAKVAEAAGVSARTVRRRLDRLVRAGALYVFPDLDVRALVGRVLVSLAVFYTDPSTKPRDQAALLDRFDASYVLTASPEPTYSAYVFLLPNLAAAEELRAFATSLPGVRFASLRLIVAVVNRVATSFRAEIADRGRRVGAAEPFEPTGAGPAAPRNRAPARPRLS